MLELIPSLAISLYGLVSNLIIQVFTYDLSLYKYNILWPVLIQIHYRILLLHKYPMPYILTYTKFLILYGIIQIYMVLCVWLFFFHVFPGPRVHVAFSVYSLYMIKVWRNLNTRLDPCPTEVKVKSITRSRSRSRSRSKSRPMSLLQIK